MAVERGPRVMPVTPADYTGDEEEFILAVERYRRENGRRFPAWSEVLAVAHALGYRKVAEPGPLPVVNRGRPGPGA